MSLAPGARLGPYEITAQIGVGGMGIVYRAFDTRLQRAVAIKTLAASGPDARQSLLREARAASALNHSHICTIYEVGEHDGCPFIAMEYIEGRPLGELIPREGLPAESVVRYGTQVAEAVEHAHRHGIVHCDLKSANVLVSVESQAKVLDFGLASRLPAVDADTLTRTATGDLNQSPLAGTLLYLAPERLRGSAADARSDVWALGVLVYEMAAGRLPFRGANPFELTAAILETSPAPLPDRIPMPLRTVIGRCLERDRARRFQHAGEVRVALETLQLGSRPSPVAWTERLPAPLSRFVARLISKDPAERYGVAAETAAALDLLIDDHKGVPARVRVVRPWPLLVLTIIFLTIGAYVIGRFQRQTLLQLSEQRLISTVASSHRAPSYSPDGKMLAYVAPDATGAQQIWVRDLEQGTSVQVTNGKANASRPRWLPASNLVLFALAGQGIWTVSPIGGTPSQLLDRGTNPNVSRDGSHIVFEHERTIWTAAADGSDVRQVKGPQRLLYAGVSMAPAVSPDGTTVAYFHAELGPNGDFWTIPAAGGTPRRLTTDLREGGWPVWTPDGRTIIVSSARAGSRTLWQIPAEGGEPSPLTSGAGEDDQPDISADGRQLAYTNVRNTWELRVKDLASGVERSLLRRGLEVLFPMFSPDGQRIAYFGRSDYAFAISTIGIDGSDPRQLTGGRELNHQPRWGSEGRDVFFFQNHPTISFRRVAALGGPSTEFRRWEWQTQNAPYFDPTGQFIAYLRQRPPGAPPSVTEHTVIHEVATGKERIWPEPHTHIGGWSPDGSSIVGWQHEAKSAASIVTICRVADASCRVVARGSSSKWAPQDDRLYFIRPAATVGTQDLWTIAIDGTGERRVADLGAFRPIDVFFDVSRHGLVAWAPLRAGDHQLWTAKIK